MTPKDLIEAVRQLGFTIEICGPDLRLCGPKGAIPPALVRELKARKTAVRGALLQEGPLPVEGWQEPQDFQTTPATPLGRVREAVRQLRKSGRPRTANDLEHDLEERAAILEHDAGLSRSDAERRAAEALIRLQVTGGTRIQGQRRTT